MLLRVLKVELLEEATAAALQDSVNAFLEAAGEAGLIDIEFRTDGTTFWCFITYSEE